MKSESVTISSRFCGPPGSGNGGYVCGLVANHLTGCVSVRLKAPPPLETALRIEASESQAKLFHQATVIAEAKSAELDLEPPAPPAFAESEEAAKGYRGFKHTPFPGCFVCGPQREAGDGLRIFPGSVPEQPIVAAPWVPSASLADDSGNIRTEFLWAALDCPGAFAVAPILPEGKAVVLGEFCVKTHGAIAPSEKCVVIGWPLQTDGRKRYAGTAVFSAAGEPVAIGQATWIEVPSSAFGGQ